MGGAALILTSAGAAVPASTTAPGRRLRAILWLAATGALFTLLLIIAKDVLGTADDTALAVAAAGALVGAVVWAAHHHPVQHAATWLAWLILVGTVTALLPHPGRLPWAAVGTAGFLWGLLAWRGRLRPARLGRALGAVAATAGAVALAGNAWGSLVAMATAMRIFLLADCFMQNGRIQK